MLTLHFSNRAEALADRLLQRLAERPGDPFVPDQLIVPSAAQRRWLTLAIAREQGVCANVRFDFLAQWLWTQIGRLVPGARAESPFSPAQLTWRVHEALADTAWVAGHARLAGYLARADDVMRYELAQRVAGLMEQLVTYRPDWLQAWQAGHDAGLPHAGDDARADERWQAALWRRLAAELGLAERHPVAAFADALQRGGAAAARARGLPASVHVFAPPAIPPLHLRLLQQLARAIDIDLYVVNPCREYWFELIDRRTLSHLAARGRDQGHEEGNRLLAAWGRQTQALVDGLVDLDGDALADDSHFVPHPGQTLLAQVQNAILDLQPLSPGSLEGVDGDRSLELHVCHSLTRELEVLHDRLLGLLAQDPTLQPGDIVVVLPDLEAAAPLVDAVFGTAPAERRIPYALTGRKRSRVNAPARALLDLLSLAASRMPVSAVFALLQQPVVARRFELDDDALQQVHDWLQAAGAHWGLDAEHRARLGMPADARHTLSDALSRLFLGHALPTPAAQPLAGLLQAAQPLAGLLPAADIQGGDALVLGRCWRFVQALSELQAAVATPQRPADWAALLLEASERFIDAHGDDLADLRELQDGIRTLAADQQRADVARALPLSVMRAALAQQLDDPARGGVPTGSVTFSSMSSLRGLPFAVVCVLGLDDGQFPSPPRVPEFDLMAAHPRRGDRQRRHDERNLFLDLLLAARSHLHLSHTGRSVRDNAVLPPSVLVADLLDTLVPAIAGEHADAAALRQARQRLVVEHPLQPFSVDAFSLHGDPRRRSHRGDLADALRAGLAAQQALRPYDAPAVDDDDADDPSDDDRPTALELPFFIAPLPAPGPEWQALSLEQLVDFFRNPCRFLLRRRLQLDLPFDDDELDDDEPFLADGRSRRALATLLLPRLLADGHPPSARDWAEAGAHWPTGEVGRRQLDAEFQALQHFAGRVRALAPDAPLPPASVSLDLQVEGRALRLGGSVDHLHPQGLRRWRYAQLAATDVLEAWIGHLALCAAAPPSAAPHTRWLAVDQTLALGPVADARAHLADLAGLLQQGLREPLHFFPRSAWTWVTSQGSENKTREAWAPGHDRAWPESQDRAYRLALRGRGDVLDERFRALAHRVFDPVLAHRIDGAP